MISVISRKNIFRELVTSSLHNSENFTENSIKFLPHKLPLYGIKLSINIHISPCRVLPRAYRLLKEKKACN